MHFSLFVYAKSSEARSELENKKENIYSYTERTGLSATVEHLENRNCLLFNSRELDSGLNISTLVCGSKLSYSLGHLYIPTDVELDYQADIESDICRRLANPVGLNYLSAPAFVGVVSDGFNGVFNDRSGVGRIYYVNTHDYFACSNHIGVLSVFRRAKLDKEAIQLFWAFGWFVGDTSPYEGIYRLPPATIVRVAGDNVRFENYSEPLDYASLVANDEYETALDSTVEEFRTSIRNYSNLVKVIPKVGLSGGRDSRVIAASMIYAGVEAEFFTIGYLKKEAEIAQALMGIGGATQYCHKTLKSAGSVNKHSEDSFEERISKLIIKWDGDNNPNKISRPASMSDGRYLITGGGGEIAHGNYYASERFLKLILDNPDDPLLRVRNYFCAQSGSSDVAKGLVRHFLGGLHRKISDYGYTGPTATDVFYLIERTRRWVAAGHEPSGFLLYSSPSFVRLALTVPYEYRRSAKIQTDLCEKMMPGWGKLAFYKAQPSDIDEKSMKGLRLWQQDYWREAIDGLNYGFLSDFMDISTIQPAIARVAAGSANGRDEAFFQKLFWVNGMKRL